MSKKDMMRIFSPEIAVRKSLLGGLRFDEDFGAGARYRMGEENIFLFEAARRGIQRIYIPSKIAQTLPNESSWFTGFDRDFYVPGEQAMRPWTRDMAYPYLAEPAPEAKGVYRHDIHDRCIQGHEVRQG